LIIYSIFAAIHLHNFLLEDSDSESQSDDEDNEIEFEQDPIMQAMNASEWRDEIADRMWEEYCSKNSENF
jgi:hypothetical protein